MAKFIRFNFSVLSKFLTIKSRFIRNNSTDAYLSLVRSDISRLGFASRISGPFLLGGIFSFLSKEEDETKKESELILTMKRGILATQRDEFKKAEQLFHLALKLAQEQQNSDAVTYCYDLLANLAFDVNDYNKAEKLFVSVMQRLMATGRTSEDNKIIHISLKLAKIYEEKGDKEKAESGYQFCTSQLENQKKSSVENEDSALLFVLVHHWYSKFLLNEGKTQEAVEHLKKAYTTCLTVNGEDHEQTVLLLSDLGTATSALGDIEQGFYYIKQAEQIGSKVADMEEYPAVLINLGRIYLLKEMMDESKKYCEQGLRLAQKGNDKVSVKEAQNCLNEILRFSKNLG